jgi:hypothetical protein
VAVISIEDYTDRLAGLPPERFIGSMLWYALLGSYEREVNGQKVHVPVRVSRPQLEEWFRELEIDQRFMPPEISRINAFRRGSTSAIPRTYALSDDETATLAVVEVDAAHDYVLRHIQRRVTNKRAERIYESNVATIRFRRGSRKAGQRDHDMEHYVAEVLAELVELDVHGKPTGNTAPMSELDKRQVIEALEDFERSYNDLSENYHADALRAVVRGMLLSTNAIMVRPSVYFIHSSRQRTVDQIDGLIERLGRGCKFRQVPLLDTMDQREMLTEAWEDEVENDVRGLLKEIGKVNAEAQAKGGKPSGERYQGLYAQYADLQERASEYTRILGLAQERAGSALDVALDALMEMSTRGLNLAGRGKRSN